MDFGTSFSTPDVSELDRNEVIGAILSSCRPNLLSGSLFGQVGRFRNRPSAFTVSLNALKSRFLHLNRRIRSLQTINCNLKAENRTVHAENALLGDELQTSRVSLYAEVEQRRKDAVHIQQTNERIADLVCQVQRYGEFIHILAGIGINNPIYRAALSVMSNVEAEDALVNSIMEAAKDKHSPWSRIIPAVVGPRSPEQYVSAINLTLQTRQDLRERERVCEFWKTTAKLDPSHADLLTPSSSTFTDVRHECMPDFSPNPIPTILDDMLEGLKNDSVKSIPFPIPHPTFESMAEWAENAAKEEYDSSLPVPISRETIGILKNISPSRTTKVSLPTPQRVRFDLKEDDASQVSGLESSATTPPSASNLRGSPDTLYSLPIHLVVDSMDDAARALDLAKNRTNSETPFVQGLSQLTDGPSHAVSPALIALSIPTQNDEINIAPPESTEHVAPAVEEFFIVKASGDVPQLSVQLLNDPFAACPQPSHPEYGLPSSGSEYSEMSADITDEETPSALQNEYSAGATQVDAHILHKKPRHIEKQALEMNKVVPIIAKTTQSSISLGSIIPSEATTRTYKPQLTDNDDKCIEKSDKWTEKHPRTPPKTKPSVFHVSTSSSPRNNSDFPPITKANSPPFNVPGRRHAPLISSKNAVPPKPIGSPIASNSLGSRSPLRNGTPLDTHNHSPSPQQSHKYVLKRPSPPNLAVPRFNALKRPPLKRIDANLPASQPSRRPSTSVAERDEADPFESKAIKASARNLGKRRGVIMLENLNIGSTSIPLAETMKDPTIVPKICEMKVCDPLASFPSEQAKSTEKYNLATIQAATRNSTTIGQNEANDSSTISSTSNRTGEGLSSLEYTACPDVSSFNSQISELIASLSDSDLGSLEMTGESDSETTCTDLGSVHNMHAVHEPQSLIALPRVCKNIMNAPSIASRNNRGVGDDQVSSHGLQSSSVASSSRLSSRRRSESLISATFGASRAGDSMTTSSSSSSLSSSSSSLSFDSPTRSKFASQSRPFGLASRRMRGNGSLTPAKTTNPTLVKTTISTSPAQPKMWQPPGPKQVGSSRSSITSPRAHTAVEKLTSSSEPTTKGKVQELDRKSILLPPSKATIQSFKIGSSNENAPPASKQHKPIAAPTHIAPTREFRSWMGQTIFNRFSNSESRTKSSYAATTPNKALKSYLSPSGTASPMKPRSNTINTLAPSFARPSALEPPSPSTKPRSNTVNTYSPITRSPLSQHVTNNSAEFQSRSTQPALSKEVPSQSQAHSHKPKPVAPSRIAQPTTKSTAPLRFTKKNVSPRTQPSSRENGPAAPTAAFMLPNISIGNTGRRASNSVAPLIPTCRSSANGVISPSQCRSLLRNSLSLVAR